MEEKIKFVREQIEMRLRQRMTDAYISELLLDLIEQISKSLPKTND